MKKILIICALLCIFLSACGKDNSIGIIGGADGPAAILITRSIVKWMCARIFIVMIVAVLVALFIIYFKKKKKK